MRSGRVSPVSSASQRRPSVAVVSLSLDDAASFDDLFRSEYTGLVRLAYLIIGSQARAEELTQDAFGQLLKAWPSVDRPGGFVRTALVSRCRDAQRREITGRRKLRLLRPAAEAEPEAHYLIDVLAKLPENWRAIVVLRFYGGHSIPEIAEITGQPEGSVKSGLHRALSQLRGQLELDEAP